MKKLIAICVMGLFLFSSLPAEAKGGSSGGGGRGASVSRSSSSARAFSSPKASINTPKASSAPKATSTPKASSSSPSVSRSSSTTVINKNHSYGGVGYYGYGSWGGGFYSGMMMGSLMNPWHVAVPAAYGGGYAAAPMSYTITFIVIDFILVILTIWFVYWLARKLGD